MKIYGIANCVHQTWGHGDSGSLLMITPQGSYGTEGFLPFYKTREEAEKRMKEIDFFDGAVIEFDLKG